MKKVLASLFLLCVMALGAAAQQQAEFIFFYPPSQTRLDPEYNGNASQMEKLLAYLRTHEKQIDSVRVYGYASPDGELEWNRWLSSRRGYTAFYYILNNSKVGWDQLKVRSSIGGDGLPRRRWRADWLSTLRYSRILVYTSAHQENTEVVASGPVLSPEVKAWTPIQPYVPASPALQYFSMPLALKTNLLLDAVSALNLGVSIPLGTHYSIDADLCFPWWHVGNRFALEYQRLTLEGRYWFNPRGKALTGHFLGLYGLVGRGDVQLGRELCYQSPFLWSAGVRYGYSFPLSARWNLELSGALGYARIGYVHYVPSEDWSVLWKDSGNEGVLSYFGPTSLGVTLVRTFMVKRRARQ